MEYTWNRNARRRRALRAFESEHGTVPPTRNLAFRWATQLTKGERETLLRLHGVAHLKDLLWRIDEAPVATFRRSTSPYDPQDLNPVDPARDIPRTLRSTETLEVSIFEPSPTDGYTAPVPPEAYAMSRELPEGFTSL